MVGGILKIQRKTGSLPFPGRNLYGNAKQLCNAFRKSKPHSGRMIVALSEYFSHIPFFKNIGKSSEEIPIPLSSTVKITPFSSLLHERKVWARLSCISLRFQRAGSINTPATVCRCIPKSPANPIPVQTDTESRKYD